MRQRVKINDPYENLVVPFFDKFVTVYLTEDEVNRVKDFSKKVSDAKSGEDHHRVDNDNTQGRFFTGFCGEMALQKYLKKEFVDLTVGESGKYNISDLRSLGLRCGVKTSRTSDFPKVPLNPKEPEVIILKVTDYEYMICGLALPDILKEYQKDVDLDELYMNEKLFRRNVKSCFYGHAHLIQFKNFKELNEILYEEGFSDTI